MPYYNRDPKRDHNFDNHSYVQVGFALSCYFLPAQAPWLAMGFVGSGTRFPPRRWRVDPEGFRGRFESLGFKGLGVWGLGFKGLGFKGLRV